MPSSSTSSYTDSFPEPELPADPLPTRPPSPKPPVAPNPPKSRAPREVYRRWPREETKALLNLVDCWKAAAGKMRKNIRWTTIVEQLLLRFPAPPGYPPRSTAQVRGHWKTVVSKPAAIGDHRSPTPTPLPTPTANEDNMDEAASEVEDPVATPELAWTATQDAEVLDLHRAWPSQYARIADAIIPQRCSRDVRKRVEQLLTQALELPHNSLKYAELQTAILARRRSSKQSSAARPSSAKLIDAPLYPSAPSQLYQAGRVTLFEAAAGSQIGEDDRPTTMLQLGHAGGSFEEALQALGELSKPW